MTPQHETQYGRTVAGTSIATMTEDAIYVRDRDLVAELIGKVDFTSMLIFHLRDSLVVACVASTMPARVSPQ